jgi:hypothetical protein
MLYSFLIGIALFLIRSAIRGDGDEFDVSQRQETHGQD